MNTQCALADAFSHLLLQLLGSQRLLLRLLKLDELRSLELLLFVSQTRAGEGRGEGKRGLLKQLAKIIRETADPRSD